MNSKIDRLPVISLCFLWLSLCIFAWLFRPLMPIDETRYISVAWEMWQSNNFLVPHLNGVPYSHKPPLLFWLVNAGWWIFGVNSWWPRLVPPLFGLGSLFLTYRISLVLWPRNKDSAFISSHLLLANILWALFSTVVMFDMLIVFFTLSALLGLLYIHRYNAFRGWFVVGACIGLGILSKGPVVLLPILPVALLAPFWIMDSKKQDWISWYSGILVSLLVGSTIALSWAIPAANYGGETYAQLMLWKQTTNRLVHSFAHNRPFWWYMARLPLLLLLWPLWISLWRGLFNFNTKDMGNRFCLSWIIPAFIIFSFVSGKQEYYLLPLFPAFALMLGNGVAGTSPRRWDILPFALFLGLLGILWLALPLAGTFFKLPDWLMTVNPLFGIIFILGCVTLITIPIKNIKSGALIIAATTVCILMIVHIGIFKNAKAYYNIKPLAEILKKLETKGYPVAHVGEYHGQYQFLGRLKHPLDVIDRKEMSKWFKEHPNGRIIIYARQWPIKTRKKIEYMQHYRGKTVAIVSQQS